MPLSTLIVRGPFRGATGYDHHVREFVRELHRQGVAIELRDLPAWSPAMLPDHLRDPWFDNLQAPIKARSVLHFCMPHQAIPVPGRLNIVYTMFEATRVPASWIRQHEQHDLVVVPTESSRQAWLRSGMSDDRIRICPLGVDPAAFSGAAALDLRLPSGRSIASFRTRFLSVSSLAPRKNMSGLLRAWILGTRADDDAVLVIKAGGHLPGWRATFEKEMADAASRTTGRSLRDAAPIYLLDELLADIDMPRVYASASHYISLSHGEGWDQPMVEAAASGLRLIAPDHSAYAAYLDPSVATLIPSREIPADLPGDPATGALFAHANWWAPNEDSAAWRIREAIDGQDHVTAAARDVILRYFTWQVATFRLIALLTEIERRSVRRWFFSRRRTSSSAGA